jgi:hypothetical protein
MEKLNITQGKWEVSQKLQVQVDIENPLKVSTVCQVYGNSDEAKKNATLIADAGTTYNTAPILPSELLKQRNELLEALQDIIKTANPTNVSSNKIFMGMDLGELYVGRCGIPSNKSIHMAINAIKNATNA